MANNNPNTEKMVLSKKNESEEKKKAVLAELEKLVLLDDPINHPVTKAEICRRAKVSKTFLFKYSLELLKPINDAIKRQNVKARMITQTKGPDFSNSSKDNLIESLKRRVQRLEEENKRLSDENKILLGKLAGK